MRLFHEDIERRDVFLLAGILFAGLAIRLVCLAEASLTPTFLVLDLDADVYHAWASAMASGQGSKAQVFEMAPLYPYLLSLLYRVTGPLVDAARGLQLFEGLSVILVTWLLGRRVGSRWIGHGAAAIMALCGPLVLGEQVLVSTTTVTLLMLIAGFLLVLSLDHRPILALAAGFASGLAALGQPGLLTLPILWGLLLAGDRSFRAMLPRPGRLALLVLAGALLAVAPVTLRNIARSGDLVLISANGGMNFFIGNHRGATGLIADPLSGADDPASQMRRYKEVSEKTLGKELSQAEVSRYWQDRTWDDIGRSPSRWVWLLFRKGIWFWNHVEVPNVVSFDLEKNYQLSLSLAFATPGIFLPFAILGLFLMLGQPVRRLLCAPVLSSWLLFILFFAADRFRAPAYPFLAVAAALAMHRIVLSIRTKDPRKTVALFAGVALAAAVVHGPRIPIDWGYEHFKIGARAQMARQPGLAGWEYRRALEYRPVLQALNNLALLMEQDGNIPKAMQYWKELETKAKASGDQRLAKRAEERVTFWEGKKGNPPD